MWHSNKGRWGGKEWSVRRENSKVARSNGALRTLQNEHETVKRFRRSESMLVPTPDWGDEDVAHQQRAFPR